MKRDSAKLVTTHKVKNKAIVEHSFECDGIRVEIASGEWTTPIYRENCSEAHKLFLRLGALPEVRDCLFPSATRRATKFGALSLRPAQIPYITNTVGGRHRWMSFAVNPKHFKDKTGLGDDWDLRFAANVMGTPMNVTLPRVATELAAPGFASELLLTALCDSTLVDLARYACGVTYDTETVRNGLSSRQLQRIKDYVESADCLSPTVTDIASVVGISGRHLTRMFKLSTGCTIHAYVAEVRLRKAINLLISTEMSAKEISHRLGFAAPWGFSAAFRSSTGQTPMEFRRHFRAHGDINMAKIKNTII